MFDIVQPLVVNWVDALDTSETFFDGNAVAPPARLEYLIGLDQLVLGAATTPYPVTGLNFEAANAGLTWWHFGWMIAPGAHALRATVVRSRTTGAAGPPADAQIWGYSASAYGAADRIDIPSPFSDGTDAYPPKDDVSWTKSQSDMPGSPSAGDNHCIELTEQLSPYFEKCRTTTGPIGMTGEVSQVTDMTTL